MAKFPSDLENINICRAGRYWNLLSRYIMAKSITVLLYITIFYFSQPETNYTMEGIILVDTLIATHCMKYILTFKQPFLI